MALPTRIGPYDVQNKLGDGGTGIVLRCVHREMGASAAVKIPKTAAIAAREALRREVGILGRLRRSQVRGVVRLLEHGGAEERPWYAMELLEGDSLRQWQQRMWSRVPPSADYAETSLTRTTDIMTVTRDAPQVPRRVLAEATRSDATRLAAAGQLDRVLRVFLRVSEVLVQLHAEGVVHGDLTPTNVVFRDETDPVLIDFGAALVDSRTDTREVLAHRAEARGTAPYLAPELISGELFDTRCDLYALGCMLYEVLTGHSPFSGSRAQDVLRQQLYYTPPAASQYVKGVPDKLDGLLKSLLEKDPRRRLSRAEDVSDMLRECMPGKPRALQVQIAPGLFNSRLFGRDEALTQLALQLSAALEGRGSLALIGGESGIGKTRLVNELGKQAAHAGMRVMWARTSRATSSQAARPEVPADAFSLFTPLLEVLLDEATAADMPDLSDFRAVAAVAKRIAERIGSDDVDELAPSAIVQRAFAAFERLLARSAHNSGLLLLIDDLQWADQLSLQFLETCTARVAQTRLALVMSYRSEEIGARVEQLSRNTTSHLVLTRLDNLNVRAMVADLLALERIPEGLVAFLARQAEGNPFFVGEYTRAAIAQGMLQRLPGGRWQFALERAQALDVPHSIAGLFQLRVQHLSARAQHALQLASLLERDFGADAFQALLGADIDCAEVLEELVARDVLTPGTPGRFRFFHDKLREAQASALEPLERTRHHVRVAEHLSRATSDPDSAAAAGYHWACAGEPARALDQLVPAARAAARAGHALDRAAELFALALQQCDGHAPLRELQPQLREELADVLIRQARYAEARGCLEQLLNELPESDRFARARVWRKVAGTHWIVHEYKAASDELDRAEHELAALRDDDPPEAWVESIQIRLSRCDQMYFAGQLGPELERRIREVEPSIERYGTPDQACTFYFTAASYAMLEQRYAFSIKAVQLAERGLVAARQLPAVRVAHAHFILAMTLSLGDVNDCLAALEHFDLALERARRTGDATLLSRILIYDAITRVRVGDVPRAATAARAALDAAQTAQMAPYIAAAQYCQGWVAWRQGDVSTARTLLQSARASWRSSPHKFPFQNLAAFPLIDLAHVSDDLDAMRELLTEVQAGLPALPRELDAAISVALAKLDTDAALQASRAVTEVLRLATAHAFA